MAFLIESVLVGAALPFGNDGELSAIAKSPVRGVREVCWLGIVGDAQADLTVHGGRDKAIHHYPRDHYRWWQAELGALPLLAQAGAFGENISTSGLVETEACIGDRYRLGSALVEIAQGRQPCWKQGHRLSNSGVVAMMVKSGRSGWYYRVIEEGVVRAGSAFELVARPLPQWTVARVTGLLIAGKGKDDPAALRDLARLEILADSWRARALKLSH